jgi:small subunit ribosomal protein S4
MGRYLGPTCKLSRRYGVDLEHKYFYSDNSLEKKCKLQSRPGQHGQSRRTESNYKKQLIALESLRYKYGLREYQFRNLFGLAEKQKGATGVNLLKLLESRLDNVVFRMGFSVSRNEARQLVTHKLIMVNGKCVNVPSYIVKAGDEISIRERGKEQVRILDAIKQVEDRGWVEWVDVNSKSLSGTYKRLPERDELPAEINEQLIVELYSK